MKIRVLTSTNKGKLLSLAEIISKEVSADYAVDVIPPGYKCDREAMVIIVASAKNTISTEFSRFLDTLNAETAKKVALLLDADTVAEKIITEKIKDAGSELVDNILRIRGGLPFKFLKKFTDEELKTVKAWTSEILKKL